MVIHVIEAVSRIGEMAKSDVGDLLDAIVENPNSKGGYRHALVVTLEENDGKFSYRGVELEELKDYRRYLYKGKKGNATDATPTCKIAKDIETTFNKKFLRWFETADHSSISGEETATLERMKDVIFSNKDKIFDDLKEKRSHLKSTENCIITIGVLKDGDMKYLADYDVYRKILLKKSCDRFFRKYGGESRGTDALCSVCRQQKDEVYAYAIPWPFHTFDKPGFIAGGFRQSNAWKNTPVCFDCAINLDAGKKYIEENLDFNFYGFRYLLIPNLVIGDDYQEILDILSGMKKELKMSKETRNRITDDEDEILDMVKDQKDFFSNSLLFYKKDNSAYRILLHIDGILPSRLRRLFDAKEKVEDAFSVYNEMVLSDNKIEMRYDFGVLRRFFPRESGNVTHDKIFLEIVNRIFVGRAVDRHLLISFMMNRIRDDFVHGRSTLINTLNGFLLLHYLKELNLLKDLEVSDMSGIVLRREELEALPLEKRVEEFFEANKAFFDTDAKKATFLEGVLAQKLLNIQWVEKNATPFYSKLHGLKMNEALIKRLLPEIQNKLEEYGKNYYRELEEIIAKHFVLSGQRWKETDDELSFYFVLGMNLHSIFKEKIEEEEMEGTA
ncbi:TIGR02556 family CRISPR-associated protein [Methanothrix sp.]|uniref:TIGR02556 family CRISPR-associated protein n=1 Tax=Methanothrix sp. TaxID=90426 RepID=UPI00257DBBE0|nr:TIGR02556 family CRISPR-associated protein [Methanothrix sp.]NPU87546.1 TIGR02556 family CRISPR-associated protein [Methanothrix sp.]